MGVEFAPRKTRSPQSLFDIDQVVSMPPESVMWVGGTEEHPRIELAPLDVGLTLDTLLWNPDPNGLEIVIGERPLEIFIKRLLTISER